MHMWAAACGVTVQKTPDSRLHFRPIYELPGITSCNGKRSHELFAVEGAVRHTFNCHSSLGRSAVMVCNVAKKKYMEPCRLWSLPHGEAVRTSKGRGIGTGG